MASEHRYFSSATPYIHPSLFPVCPLVTRRQSPTRTNFIGDVLKEQIMVYCILDVRKMHGSSYFQRIKWIPCCFKSRHCRKVFFTNSRRLYIQCGYHFYCVSGWSH